MILLISQLLFSLEVVVNNIHESHVTINRPLYDYVIHRSRAIPETANSKHMIAAGKTAAPAKNSLAPPSAVVRHTTTTPLSSPFPSHVLQWPGTWGWTGVATMRITEIVIDVSFCCCFGCRKSRSLMLC